MAERDEAKDFQLALAQVTRTSFKRLSSQPSSELRIQVGLALGGQPNSEHQLSVSGILEYVPESAGGERPPGEYQIALHCQNHNSCVWCVACEPRNRVEAKTVWHIQIEDQHVGLMTTYVALGGRDIASFRNNLEAGLGLQQHPQPRAHDRVVVGDHDANCSCLRFWILVHPHKVQLQSAARIEGSPQSTRGIGEPLAVATGNGSASRPAYSVVMESSDETIELRDGSRVRFRAPTPADSDQLLGFLQSLSPESRRLRFFSPACDLAANARWASNADGVDHIGLLALDQNETIVAHAACERLYGLRGEVAVEVDEDHRHLGLASLLLRRLARDAERQGIRTLIAEVLPENHEMLAVFHDEFCADDHHVDDEIDVEFPSAAWETTADR